MLTTIADLAQRRASPHAAHEEETSYRAAGRLLAGEALVTAMLMEHVLIRDLVGRFETVFDPAAAAAYGRALLAAMSAPEHGGCQ